MAASAGAGILTEPAPSGGSDVLALYDRCKALTLAAGASLLLERPDPSLRADALALADEVLATPASTSNERIQIAHVRDAALAVAELVDDGDPAALDRALTAQKKLRAQLGSLLAPQYSPCGAHSHGSHREEAGSA